MRDQVLLEGGYIVRRNKHFKCNVCSTVLKHGKYTMILRVPETAGNFATTGGSHGDDHRARNNVSPLSLPDWIKHEQVMITGSFPALAALPPNEH